MLGFFICHSLYAQNPPEIGNLFIHNYTGKEYKGYPQNWGIIQDERGMIYAANNIGILEYDGVNWRMIYQSVGTTTFRSLALGKEGRIYLGMEGNMGYLKADSKGEYRFHSLLTYIPEDLRDFLEPWRIYATREGIYFQTQERLFRFTETADGWEVKHWEPEHRFMFCFWLDETLYVHQRNIGLMKLENDELVLIPGGELLVQDRLQVMLPLHKEGADSLNYLLFTFTHGAFTYDGHEVKKYPTNPAFDAFVNDNPIYKGTLLNDGTIALASIGNGLVIVDREINILQIINSNSGLQDNNVYEVFLAEYPANYLWLALDRGISRVDVANPMSIYGEELGLHGIVLSVIRYQEHIYAGAAAGLAKLNPQTNKFDLIPGLDGSQVWQMHEIDGELIVVSGVGISKVIDDEVVDLIPSINGDFTTYCLTRSTLDSNRYYAGITGGLAVVEKKADSSWRKVQMFPLNKQVRSIEEAKDGTLWLGTTLPGITKVSFPSAIENFNDVDISLLKEEHGLPNLPTIVRKMDGEMYFLNTKGVFKYQQEENLFHLDTTLSQYTAARDFDDYILKKTPNGDIWLDIGDGLTLLSAQPNGTYQVDRSLFRPFSSDAFSNIYVEENGITWIAFSEGLIRYDSRKLQYNSENYSVFIRNVYTKDDSIIYHGDNIQVFQDLSLVYDYNQLRINFAAPYFKQEDQTQYQSWLEGFQSDWTTWSHTTEREFINLPEGDYTFHVRAKNIYDTISEEAVLHFTILPPWYRTWWAYLLYLSLGVLTFYLLIRLRTRQLDQQRKVLEQGIRERTREIQQRVDELATVNDVSKAISSQLQTDELIQQVGDQMQQLFNADIAYVALLDEDGETIRFPYGYGDTFPELKLGEGLASRVLQSGQPLLINRNSDKKYEELGLERIGLAAASYIGVPIKEGNKVQGVLSIQSTTTENRFKEEDQRLLNTIATHVGIALHNAGLFQKTERAMERAEEANEAKSTFLSTVSHELRTPLTSVLGFAKIINRRLQGKIFPLIQTDDPKIQRAIRQVKDNLEVVVSEGERLTGLINDVLDLAKIEAGKFEWDMKPLLPRDVLDRALAATSSLFDQKDLPLHKNIADNLTQVEGDRDRLIQVVINLISNAVKFTDEGAVTLNAFQENDQLVVSVVDTGMGIAPEDQPKVFEKFKQVGDTLTDKPKGTGLGLPICREIIEQHGGRIWVESEIGKGSTFSFSLPAVKNEQLKKKLKVGDLNT